MTIDPPTLETVGLYWEVLDGLHQHYGLLKRWTARFPVFLRVGETYHRLEGPADVDEVIDLIEGMMRLRAV